MVAVREDHPLRRAVTDVPLVPERVVLGRGHRIPAQQSRQPGHSFRGVWIPLVGHRRGALIPRVEWLFDLSRPPSAGDGESRRCDLLQRSTDAGNDGKEEGVAIALQDLRRCRGRGQPEIATYFLLQLKRNVRMGADRARDLADGNVLSREGQAPSLPTKLVVPDGELETKRRWLGVHAMRSANRRSVLVGDSLPRDDGKQRLELASQVIDGGCQLDAEGRVDNVGACQSDVNVASRRAHRFRRRPQKSDHVMIDFALDLHHPLQIA